MVKNYWILYFRFFIYISFLLVYSQLQGQEIKIFKVSDFDLKGPVKSCFVSTNYGKEEYNFNKDGFLIKSVTRYSDTDYDITYYKYEKNELLEKRLETYREDIVDKSTSIANIYTIDTTKTKKIIEKIISYTTDFLDQYEYVYDTKNRLVDITRTNDNGIDETTITYTNYKGETTITHNLNETLLKSTRRSNKKLKDGTIQHIVLTKEFIEGIPEKAVEFLYQADNVLISKVHFVYNADVGTFEPKEQFFYTYDIHGILTELKTKIGEDEQIKTYVYQFDDGEKRNWVKEIITPDNTYTTRRITYFNTEVGKEEE